MDMISSVQNFETARSSAEIQYAVAAKIMKTTSQLQEDLVNQLLGKSGIGNNLNQIARKLHGLDAIPAYQQVSLLAVLTSLDRQLSELLETQRDRQNS